MPKILVGTPCYNGLVHTEYVISMLGLQGELSRRGIGLGVEMTTTVSLIPVARNFLVSKMLQDPSYTHLLFIDADLAFDPAQVPRFLAFDKDVVAGIYPIKHLDLAAAQRLGVGTPMAQALNYTVLIPEGEKATVDGFARAEYAATGFMLIRRNVIEQMIARYPELQYHSMFARLDTAGPSSSNLLYALFDSLLDHEKGVYLPEDYTFCKRWREMGGEIWVDVLSKFDHIGQFAYRGDFSVFVQRS